MLDKKIHGYELQEQHVTKIFHESEKEYKAKVAAQEALIQAYKDELERERSLSFALAKAAKDAELHHAQELELERTKSWFSRWFW